MTIRVLEEVDDLEALTSLLNRGYAGLAQQGLRYVASWMTPDMVRERLNLATCFVMTDGADLIGTGMLYAPDPNSECRLYRRPDVRYFGKFTIDPARRGEGLGRMLFLHLENEARHRGAEVFACDTAKPATALIQMYRRWGFEIVGEMKWSLTNYESVILAKALT